VDAEVPRFSLGMRRTVLAADQNRDLLDLVERELLVKVGQGCATHFRLKSPES
jgi:hypothetical protein